MGKLQSEELLLLHFALNVLHFSFSDSNSAALCASASSALRLATISAE
jgi:hypothetical protein